MQLGKKPKTLTQILKPKLKHISLKVRNNTKQTLRLKKCTKCEQKQNIKSKTKPNQIKPNETELNRTEFLPLYNTLDYILLTPDENW